MRFHVVSLPHTQTTKEFLPCAYTQKVINFCRMMKSLDHQVFLYASEDNDAPCDEFVTCITKKEQSSWFMNSDWKKNFFHIPWEANHIAWLTMNSRAIKEISKRLDDRDFICLIGGNCQRPIADAFPGKITVEYGVGYEGVFSQYRVFESYAWMHHVYGLTGQKIGRYFDAVIPNYFDPIDFPEPTGVRDDYFLFIGRLVHSKGPHIAAQVANVLGKKLILAGQGVVSKAEGKIVGQDVIVEGNVEHVGSVGVADRARLMSKAKAVFVQTQYIGPFEGVAAEAMLCGTPVITTDWGVFVETVLDGRTGYRTRSLGETIWAARNLDKLWTSDKIRAHALAKWSMDTVKYQYQEYFLRLLTLWEKGWETEEYSPFCREQRCSV